MSALTPRHPPSNATGSEHTSEFRSLHDLIPVPDESDRTRPHSLDNFVPSIPQQVVTPYMLLTTLLGVQYYMFSPYLFDEKTTV